MKAKVFLLDRDAANTVDKLACFTARLTQRTLGPMNGNDTVGLYYKPPNPELVHKLIKAKHSQCFRMNMVPVLIIGASRRFIMQITRHQVGVSFMASSLQYCAWEDPDFMYDDIPEAREAYEKQMVIYREMLKHGSDVAGYFMPSGMQSNIVISATPWEWRHILETRLCKRNTPETREIMEAVRALLRQYSEVFDVGPACEQDGCVEIMKCRNSTKE